MPATTPGYLKNMIRRCFRELVDKSPTKKQMMEYGRISIAVAPIAVGN